MKITKRWNPLPLKFTGQLQKDKKEDILASKLRRGEVKDGFPTASCDA